MGSMRVNYRLAETYFTIAGTVDYETDEYGSKGEERARADDTATVTMGLRADVRAEATVDFDKPGSDDEYTVMRTVDGRLSSIGFNSAGAGAKLVSGLVTVVAFVGGIAARVVGAPLPEAAGEPKADVRDTALTPDEKAQSAWDEKHPDEAELRDKYRGLVNQTASKLVDARNEAVTAQRPAAQAAALERARRLTRVLADSKSEIDRIDALYRAWRASTKSTRTETVSHDVAIGDLPSYTGVRPTPAELPTRSKKVWDDLGVIVQVEPVGDALAGKPPPPPEISTPRLDPRITLLTGASHALAGKPAPEDLIRWRVPRPARLWVWRRGEDEKVLLDTTAQVLVVDDACKEAAVPIDDRLFGEHSGLIEFGELGAPSKITQAEKGALGAIFSTLQGTPEAIVAGLESAGKAEAAFTGLLDARSARRLATLKRQLETIRTELDGKGLAATSADYARLKSLEQQVAISEAEGSLGRTLELNRLKTELDIATTQAALEKIQAGETEGETAHAATIEGQLTALEKRVAALEGAE